MQQNQLPPEPDPWAEEDLVEDDDKGALDRFAEAFTSPSEAFEGLNRSPRRGSIIGWGFAIGIVVALFSTALLTSNTALVHAMSSKMLQKFEQKHEAGEINDEQYQQIVKQAEEADNPQGFAKVRPYLAAPVQYAIGWSIAALVVFGIAHALKGDDVEIKYSTSLAMYLIALMVPLLEMIIYSIGAYFTSDPAFSLDPNLLIRSTDPMIRTVLGMLGPLTLWWFYLIGTGIATISGGSRTRAIVIWVVLHVIVQGALMAFKVFIGLA